MLLYLLSALLCFTIIFLSGFSTLCLANRLGLSPQKYSMVNIFFSGFVVLSVLTSYISIVLKIDLPLTTVFLCLSILSSFFYRKEFGAYLSELNRLTTVDKVTVPLILVLLSFISSNGIFNYDSGLYHVQAINWIHDYPVVQGLGNLHGRLAFNSLFFPISSAFSMNTVIGTHEILIFPLNTVALFVFFSWQYFNVKSLHETKNLRGIIFITIVTLFCGLYLLKWASSPSPDVIATILILIACQVVTFQKTDIKQHTVLLVGIVFCCISFKLSAVFLCLTLLLIVRKEKWMSDLLKIGVAGGVILLPFLIRNYYLSGYLVYPFPAIDIFDPDWKMPMTQVLHEKSWIESWARIPNKKPVEVLNLAFTTWFPEWFVKKNLLTKSLLLTAATIPFLAVIQFIKKKTNALKICLILFVNLLFWFVQAPDPRFAWGFLFFSSAYAIYLTSDLFGFQVQKKNVIKAIVFTCAIVTIAPIGRSSLTVVKSSFQNLSQLIYPIGFPNTVEETSVEKMTGNFDLYKPTTGDRCFNCPIPCTPYPNDTVFMRTDDFIDGFQIRSSLNE